MPTHDAVATKQAVKEVKDSWDANFNKTNQALDHVQDRMDALEAGRQKAGLARSNAVEGKGPFLGLEQKAAPHIKAASTEYDPANVSLGKLMACYLHKAAVFPQLNEDEQKAYSINIDPSGGFLIPAALGRIFIDAVRPRMQVLNAGAVTYPMEAHTVILPGWDAVPRAGWRTPDKGLFGDAGGSFREVNLTARDVGCYTDISNVLIEDAGVNIQGVANLIEAQLTKAIAQAVDLAALLSTDVLSGPGTHVPIGLASVDAAGTVTTNYGIPQSTDSGNNGGTPTNWDWIINAASTVAGNNFLPTAHLTSSRTMATLGKLKLTTNDYLRRPHYLDAITDLPTNQIGSAYKKGTSNNNSLSFVGDFSQMVIGVRGEMGVLHDPYTQGLGRTTRLILWGKYDVGVLQKGAFTLIDGIQP